MRFTSDANTQATGFVFSYACGSPAADVAPCASEPCQNGGSCFESTDVDGFWCSCTFGFNGPLCADSVPLEGSRDCALQLAEVADRVTSTCCGTTSCDGGVPSSCSTRCAAIWAPFARECDEFLDGTMPQMAPFTASCEVKEYGIEKRRCPQSVWQAGVTAVLAACCPHGDRQCANDITRLPDSCPTTGSCAALVAEFYAICHIRAEQMQPAAFRAVVALKHSCQQQ